VHYLKYLRPVVTRGGQLTPPHANLLVSSPAITLSLTAKPLALLTIGVLVLVVQVISYDLGFKLQALNGRYLVMGLCSTYPINSSTLELEEFLSSSSATQNLTERSKVLIIRVDSGLRYIMSMVLGSSALHSSPYTLGSSYVKPLFIGIPLRCKGVRLFYEALLPLGVGVC